MGPVRGWLTALILVAAVAVPAVPARAAEGAEATSRSYSLYVDGLACPFCVYGIEKELARIPGVTNVQVHIRDGRVVVTMAEGAGLSQTAATKAVENAGFTLRRFKFDGGP